jgi:protein phosphatase
MVRRGVLSAEAAETHRWRHVITNAVGGNSDEVKIEFHKVHLETGDAALLCSDGLTNMLPDEEIARILQKEADPERACRQLVARANEAGGHDNVTVIIARYEAAPDTEGTLDGLRRFEEFPSRKSGPVPFSECSDAKN